MEPGIFQGCPVSPLLFRCAIEVLAISIKNNEDICGIKVGGAEKKRLVFWQMTQHVFLHDDLDFFNNLFDTLKGLTHYQVVRSIISKSEAIHIVVLKAVT